MSFRPALGSLVALIVSLANPAVGSAQTVVYDNLDPSAGFDFFPALFEGTQLGDEITLGPGPRQLTGFRFAPGASVPMARFDLTLRFYEAAVGAPGAEFWSGTYSALESYGGIFVMHNLPLPNVTVPDTFVWTVEVEYHAGFSDASAYFNAFGGPVVGASEAFVWVFDHPAFGPGWLSPAVGPCALCTFNLACSFFAVDAPPTAEFLRGDSNDDGIFNIADAVYLLAALLVPGSPASACSDASDVNDDGALDIADAVYQLVALFVSGSPGPSADCVADTTTDPLDCAVSSSCP